MPRKFCVFVPVFLALSALVVASAEEGPVFHFTESPGPLAVGLKVVEQYDYARTYRPAIDDLGKPYQGERARPLQTLIWYPAQKSGGKPMTVGDYTALAATETSFGKPAPNAHFKDWIDGMKPTLAQPMWSVKDAPILPGRFPVVIYAPSFSAMSWENADLCEYLASHGYVVLASPDMGAMTREMTGDIRGIDAQAGDISFLIGYAQTLPDTDMSEVAVGGFSWGGISNLFAASRDNRIDALFALDGSMRYYPGLVKQAEIHPEQMSLPLLYFTQGEISLEEAEGFAGEDKNPGPNVLNLWTHGDLITVHDMALVHVEHSSMYQRNADTWKNFAAEEKGDYGREDGIAGYAWVARYTLHFLDAYLKHDADSMAWLKKTPIENGAPKHLLTVNFRAAKGRPATFETFRTELGKEGFDHAEEVYASMQKNKSDFKLDEGTVNSWGQSLIAGGHLPEAIDVLKLNVKNHPDSADAYGNLGEAYAKAGEKQLAIDNLKKALEKDPNNEDAKKKLKELGETAEKFK
jgi:tetratricopeptide (TPR) repeat protein